MDWELLAQLATTLTFVVGVIALVSALRDQKRQMAANLFVEYTDRFSQVISKFPEGVWLKRLDETALLPISSPELTQCIMQYVNLCFEEFYLKAGGYITDDLWQIWKTEIQDSLRSPLFRREWPLISREFMSYPDFIQFVESVQKTHKQQ